MFSFGVGMPVVYTPKNLFHGLAFSNFVWDHSKRSPNTPQEKVKGKKGMKRGQSYIGRWLELRVFTKNWEPSVLSQFLLHLL